jgi:hypothetical protein
MKKVCAVSKKEFKIPAVVVKVFEKILLPIFLKKFSAKNIS